MRVIKSISAVLLMLLLFGCAPLGSSIKVEGNTMKSVHPPYAIQFKNEPNEVFAKGTARVLFFDDLRRKHIEVYSYDFGYNHKLEAYYPLHQIATNHDFYYHGAVRINDHEWAKIVNYSDKQNLYCGFMTRKDDALIFIGVRDSFIDSETRLAMREYNTTRTMSETALAGIEKRYDYFDSVAEITD